MDAIFTAAVRQIASADVQPGFSLSGGDPECARLLAEPTSPVED
jgi:hypothetical protein